MRSRRLPGQRPQDNPGSGVRRPAPPAEPAPLPAEVYFDAQRRKREEPRGAEIEEPEEPEMEPDEVGPFAAIARRYGARSVAVGAILLQFSVGLLMLPRIVNAAETLLVRPANLMVLAAIGIVELTMAGWGFWTRSWFGVGSSVALAAAWWIYLIVQIS